MPHITEVLTDDNIDVPINPSSIVKRVDYNNFYLENRGLALMPRHMRMDLPPLPGDFELSFGIVPAVTPPIAILRDREFPEIMKLESENAHAMEKLVKSLPTQQNVSFVKLNVPKMLPRLSIE